MEKDEGQDYLRSLLNKDIRILITDGRIFRGAFKCTDQHQNVVLAQTFEYRQPSTQQREAAAAAAEAAGRPPATLTMDLTSRYLGLVVVPGHHIIKMELEQFASQVRNAPAII
ncbi:unnamed protein product [Clonostachys solani]|uniref:Sm domain-containing protein n=1 Tax=Clonostachys solani TaxID=160281 RepID=A0A9N9ZJB8_9HYPO|nr:unnamed protein product [Clonostachys solani]